MNDGDKLGRADGIPGKIAAGGGRLRRVAPALRCRADVVADFQLTAPVHVLPRETAVPDELAVERFDDP
jgi:hypothetical protein